MEIYKRYLLMFPLGNGIVKFFIRKRSLTAPFLFGFVRVMKVFFLLVFFSVWGCSSFMPNGRIKINGTQRTFNIHIPKGYKNKGKPVPVLFVFHGNPSKSWQMQLYTGMNKTADKNNFIVIYPNALEKRWSFTNCEKVENDTVFIKKLLLKIGAQYHIDSSRLYFCGMSGGGFFVSVLAGAIPDKIAAMVLVASGKVAPTYNTCPKKITQTPMPFLLIHGTSDFLYHGTKYILSAEQTIQYWLKTNQCNPTAKITALANTNTKDHSNVLKIQYDSKIGKDVLFYKIQNGGHHWPNSRFNANTFVKFDLGHLNKDFDTNQAIWDFVSAYKK